MVVRTASRLRSEFGRIVTACKHADLALTRHRAVIAYIVSPTQYSRPVCKTSAPFQVPMIAYIQTHARPKRTRHLAARIDGEIVTGWS